MPIFYEDYNYRSDIDVLVRAYKNQSNDYEPKELFCGEVLFKEHLDREHERFTSEFPRGVAEACAAVVKTLDKSLKIQVSNELPSAVDHLTSCDKHFDIRFRKNI